jgi:hypothetical protein
MSYVFILIYGYRSLPYKKVGRELPWTGGLLTGVLEKRGFLVSTSPKEPGNPLFSISEAGLSGQNIH